MRYGTEISSINRNVRIVSVNGGYSIQIHGVLEELKKRPRRWVRVGFHRKLRDARIWSAYFAMFTEQPKRKQAVKYEGAEPGMVSLSHKGLSDYMPPTFSKGK